jgi:hypothetical protein
LTTRQAVHDASVWRARDVRDASAWSVVLSDDERDELVDMAGRALESGRTVATLRREDVPLPMLADKIARWTEELRRGRGFVLVRRFPVDRLSPEAVELAYVGLGLHFGTPVGQDAHGTLLGHVRDERVPRDGPAVRLYTTNARQDFHTDGADIVGLLCLLRAKSGGESRIASALAVYNEMLRRRPDLVDVMHQPMYWDRNDEQSAGEDPFFALPPFSIVNGRPRVFYIGWYIRDAQRHPRVPRLTGQQLEAMELLETIANDPEFFCEMDFQPGDIQFIANATILHSREAYEDHEEPGERRHLLRLWLTAHEFASVDDMLRGGIPQQRR